jgi:hypothetical protein
MGPCVD